jgi:hypothetical protein
VLWILDNGFIYTYILLSVNTYKLYIKTPRPNTNRHAQKCLHCAGIEPATSCVVGEYFPPQRQIGRQTSKFETTIELGVFGGIPL